MEGKSHQQHKGDNGEKGKEYEFITFYNGIEKNYQYRPYYPGIPHDAFKGHIFHKLNNMLCFKRSKGFLRFIDQFLFFHHFTSHSSVIQQITDFPGKLKSNISRNRYLWG